MAQVKGSALLPRWNYVVKRGNASAQAKVLSQVNSMLRQEIEQGIMPAKWYPFAYYLELSQTIDRVLGQGDLALVKELGRFSADESLHGIYKFFYKVGSPEVIIRSAAIAWKQYFQNGDIKVKVEKQNHVRMTCSNIEEPSHVHCLSVNGWVQRTLELSGAKNVVIDETHCPEHGENYCEFDIRWD